MLTAVSDIDSVKKCISLGAAHFIRKDNPLPKIVELIRESIKKFEEKRKLNAEKYDLNILLKEIEEDNNELNREITG